ncbi:MAG: LLM class flavin-dependent oxidoreductase [Actinomycetota bacterium]
MARPKLSILDLASIGEGETIGQSLAGCVAVAQSAEKHGYERVWYAEHHNSEFIASSSPAVLIAHVAAHTSTIRLGAGGVMLPNHSPLVVAEQFGTLAALHPGRIDLGLGRAPGTDQTTFMAMRRDPRSSERFPQDVLELQAFFSDSSRVANVVATPGRGTNVPLYILGSSLFGAQLAAALGLPFAFASHFAPDALHEAIDIYRSRFEPSRQLDAPYLICGHSVIVADNDDDAERQFQRRRRTFAKALFSPPGNRMTDEQAEELLASPRGAYLNRVFHYSAIGTAESVVRTLDAFAADTGAHEIITAHHADRTESRVHSIDLLASAWSTPIPATAGAGSTIAD